MSTSAPETKEAAAPIPQDRPMTGILTRDDGRRTEHNLHPLDPSYSGTPIAQNSGVAEARDARVAAGLEQGERTDAPAEGSAE